MYFISATCFTLKVGHQTQRIVKVHPRTGHEGP